VYYPVPAAPEAAPQPEPAPAQDSGAAELSASQDALAEQIRQLSANLEAMKNANQQQPPVPQSAVELAQPEPEQPPIKLVLRNGQQLTIKSYAVMNGVLWDFSGQRVRKVPISQVDLTASAKATEAAGGEFPNLQ
jgi:hypothetical protein